MTSGKSSRNPYPEIATVDYIRLATFNFKTYLDVSSAMRLKFVGWRKSRWLQYKMERSQDNVSYGLGEQSKKPHGIFESSGIDAHVFMVWLLNTQQEHLPEIYATRVDFQVTKQIHPTMDWIKCYKRIAKPKQIIMSDDGNTLYVGNRESDTFWRVYNKTETLVRAEIELKGNQAKRAWGSLKLGESTSDIYNHYLGRSRLPSFLVKYYHDNSAPLSMQELAEVIPKDLETTMSWLATLDGLIYKLANDHDMGPRMEILVNRWAEYVQDLDNGRLKL